MKKTLIYDVDESNWFIRNAYSPLKEGEQIFEDIPDVL